MIPDGYTTCNPSDQAMGALPHCLIPPGTLYTLGYTQREAAARLDRLMRKPMSLLLDIRLSPRSRWYPEWNKAALKARYGAAYRWEGRLGNSNYQHRERGIQLAAGHMDAIGEIVSLLNAGVDVILLCACANERTCHRLVVAQLVQQALTGRKTPPALMLTQEITFSAYDERVPDITLAAGTILTGDIDEPDKHGDICINSNEYGPLVLPATWVEVSP